MAPSEDSGNAPSWLFSFVDLAFLMVIAMTQVANPGAIDLGELIVPRIASEQTEAAPAAARDGWQLRVHPPSEAEGPFQLVRSQDAAEAAVVRIGERAVREQLLALDALALALTSSIFALVGFALLEAIKIRLYGRLLVCLDDAARLGRKTQLAAATV